MPSSKPHASNQGRRTKTISECWFWKDYRLKITFFFFYLVRFDVSNFCWLGIGSAHDICVSFLLLLFETVWVEKKNVKIRFSALLWVGLSLLAGASQPWFRQALSPRLTEWKPVSICLVVPGWRDSRKSLLKICFSVWHHTGWLYTWHALDLLG